MKQKLIEQNPQAAERAAASMMKPNQEAAAARASEEAGAERLEGRDDLDNLFALFVEDITGVPPVTAPRPPVPAPRPPVPTPRPFVPAPRMVGADNRNPYNYKFLRQQMERRRRPLNNLNGDFV